MQINKQRDWSRSYFLANTGKLLTSFTLTDAAMTILQHSTLYQVCQPEPLDKFLARTPTLTLNDRSATVLDENIVWLPSSLHSFSFALGNYWSCSLKWFVGKPEETKKFPLVAMTSLNGTPIWIPPRTDWVVFWQFRDGVEFPPPGWLCSHNVAIGNYGISVTNVCNLRLNPPGARVHSVLTWWRGYGFSMYLRLSTKGETTVIMPVTKGFGCLTERQLVI